MPDLETRVVALEAVVECRLTHFAQQSAAPEVWMADFKAELDNEAENAVLMPGDLGDAARRGLDVGRLAKLIAVLCVVTWRCFWTTMIARAAPQVPAALALTPVEIDALDRVAPSRPGITQFRTLASQLVKVARLGGYLARAHDPPPGIVVMWRGWSRLADILIGVELDHRRCG